MPGTPFGRKITALLRLAPIRVDRNGYRWGVRLFRPHGIARLLASDHLIRVGDEIHLATRPARRPGHQDAAGAVS